VGELQSRPTQAKMRDPIQNITKGKKAGGMVQVVECLASKCKALSSNPRTAKTEQQK
jgi:hypothetical protein